ncbi:hypothetical protein A7P96_01270 [Eikenella sp. NML03-A-027]|uniref:hypothetical protein n=1 Tax=unclassified Eikenella TaxID=2639367 RepID=UPI0007E23FB4|nr:MULTISPECIES: hypothetical protein [unclassified Eikenella]OAM27782.1 hypothetical protein A7P94_05135 [Eikenella sp. NML01-A-086]OAM32828.1 hypothetical protein A7P96_01270 [Eikenella sp. NML03-A-027]OAM33687.1 hypothetical protein A7P97_07085 [Eikenella sp. NML070372]
MAKVILTAALLWLSACTNLAGYPTVCSQPKPKTDTPRLAAAQIRAGTSQDRALELLTQSLHTATVYAKRLEEFADSCRDNPAFKARR